MLDTVRTAPDTYRFPCHLEPLDLTDADRGHRWRLFHANGHTDAWSWLPVPAVAAGQIAKGTAVTLPVQHAGSDHLLMAFERDELCPLRGMLSDRLCPLPGVVEQTAALVDALLIAPLRCLVTDALLQPLARHDFWQAQASRAHHHAYPGGLAQHSLEVATMLASSKGLPFEDRELGIAIALLHDYGKVLTCSGRRVTGARLTHEQAGLMLLQPLLDLLIQEREDLGLRMQELLGGPRAPREQSYPLAIGKIVRAFDQMSCEANRRPQPF
jgi:hypothetical protein